MGLGHYLVEAHLREGRSVAELARTHGIHRSWLYKLLARYRREGEAGPPPRPPRPHRLPAALSQAPADRSVPPRPQALRQGVGGGARAHPPHPTPSPPPRPPAGSTSRHPP